MKNKHLGSSFQDFYESSYLEAPADDMLMIRVPREFKVELKEEAVAHRNLSRYVLKILLRRHQILKPKKDKTP
jgi:hypothetical protein